MKKILLPLLVVLTLTGCHTKPELRKDIADFISQFSLKESMDTYKSGGYTYLVEDNIEGKKSVIRIEMEFSYLDANHPTYSKITTNYEKGFIFIFFIVFLYCQCTRFEDASF